MNDDDVYADEPRPWPPHDNGRIHQDSMGWWTISGAALLDLLRRAHAGESPDLIYAEEYANCEIHGGGS